MAWKHCILKTYYGDPLIIGPFDTFKEANEYRNIKVKEQRKMEDESQDPVKGAVSYTVVGMQALEGRVLKLMEPNPKTCGCCEHDK
jgi:hypothetical protein